MKLKRFAALGTSLALALSLSVTGAYAAQFTDLINKDGSPHWATTDIERMAAAGLANGYADGSYLPEGLMTAAETLLFCARVTGVDKETQEKIAADRAQEMKETLPQANNMNVWAAKEMAVAVEAGVLSLEELEALAQPNPLTAKVDANGVTTTKTYLEDKISRENICMYLVRAMQLEPLAKGLTTYPLTYTDADQISPALQPYVYVLTNFGIIKGTNLGTFDPKGSVTRAQMTTMLARGLDFMKDYGISTELSEYTTYDWQGGVITSVTQAKDNTVVVSITSELSGLRTYALPNTVKIYEDNLLTTSSALKAGQYVRFNFNKSGAVTEARLTGVLTTYAGTISSLAENKLSILVGGQPRSFQMDRFTEVSVNKQVGDRSLIDYDAGYTSAICYVDETGHLAAVSLAGGTQLADGLVEGVTTLGNVTTLGVTAFNGVVYHYTIPSGTAVTVNGSLGSLSTSHVGKYVQLRVDATSGEAVSVAVDTVSNFIQGPIRKTAAVGGNTTRSVTIRDQFTGKEKTYVVNANAAITYDGELQTVHDLTTGWYVTALVSNDIITQIEAYPGSITVEGTLSSISYGATTTLQITQKDDSVVTYNLDITDLPTIVREGKTSSIEQLRTGDSVIFTIRYNEVEKIEATAQTANLTGVIAKITMETGGVTMEVRFDDGTTTAYTVSEGVSVSQAGAASNIYNLKPGFTVGLVTNGDKVVSIDIIATASSATRLTGTVYTITSAGNNRTMTVLVTDTLGNSTPVVVNVKEAALLDIKGSSLSLASGFPAGTLVELYGQYDGAIFVASIVIRQQ